MLAESMTVRYWATCSFPMSFGHPLLASSDSCTRDRSKDRGFSTSGFASQIYVDSPRFHNLPPNQTSSFYVPSCLALFHLSSHRPVPSGASGFPCKVTRVQVAQWVHICGTRHGCCFCSCQATLGSWPKYSIHALIMAWSKKTNWLVVSTLKNMKVSWDDYSLDMENITCSKTTTTSKKFDRWKNHQGWTCELGIQGGLSGFFASLDGGCPETGPRTGTPQSIRLGLTRSAKCDCLSLQFWPFTNCRWF